MCSELHPLAVATEVTQKLNQTLILSILSCVRSMNVSWERSENKSMAGVFACWALFLNLDLNQLAVLWKVRKRQALVLTIVYLRSLYRRKLEVEHTVFDVHTNIVCILWLRVIQLDSYLCVIYSILKIVTGEAHEHHEPTGLWNFKSDKY